MMEYLLNGDRQSQDTGDMGCGLKSANVYLLSGLIPQGMDGSTGVRSGFHLGLFKEGGLRSEEIGMNEVILAVDIWRLFIEVVWSLVKTDHLVITPPEEASSCLWGIDNILGIDPGESRLAGYRVRFVEASDLLLDRGILIGVNASVYLGAVHSEVMVPLKLSVATRLGADNVYGGPGKIFKDIDSS